MMLDSLCKRVLAPMWDEAPPDQVERTLASGHSERQSRYRLSSQFNKMAFIWCGETDKRLPF